jgi:hypothetical protein
LGPSNCWSCPRRPANPGGAACPCGACGGILGVGGTCPPDACQVGNTCYPNDAAAGGTCGLP